VIRIVRQHPGDQVAVAPFPDGGWPAIQSWFREPAHGLGKGLVFGLEQQAIGRPGPIIGTIGRVGPVSSQIECILGAGRQCACRALIPRTAPTGVTPPCQARPALGAMVRNIRSMLGMPTERDEAKPQWTWNRSTRFARSGGSVRSTFPVRLT